MDFLTNENGFLVRRISTALLLGEGDIRRGISNRTRCVATGKGACRIVTSNSAVLRSSRLWNRNVDSVLRRFVDFLIPFIRLCLDMLHVSRDSYNGRRTGSVVSPIDQLRCATRLCWVVLLVILMIDIISDQLY